MEGSGRGTRRRNQDERQDVPRRPGESRDSPPSSRARIQELRPGELPVSQGGAREQESQHLFHAEDRAMFELLRSACKNFICISIMSITLPMSKMWPYARGCSGNIKQRLDPIELISRHYDGTDITIKIRLVNEVSKFDASYNHVLNIIVKRCLSMLNLVMIRRNYYDKDAAIQVPNHLLTVWPGYTTTIRQHDGGYLLNVDIRHKILRTDTAYDVMEKIRRESTPDSLEQKVKSALLGAIVMTKYNNKTYRVDDVAFDVNPMSTFHLSREDREITYAEYYRTRYQTSLRNMTQPLLVSRPSRRDINRGDIKPIFLIPELCGMTGLSESQQTNMTLRRDMANAMRLDPNSRVENLMRFRRRLTENAAIQQELRNWGVQFSENVVRVEGHLLVSNLKIILGSRELVPQRSGWSESMKRCQLAQPPKPITKWAFVYSNKNINAVKKFMTIIQEVSEGLQLRFAKPDEYAIQNDRISDYTSKIEEICRTTDVYSILVVFLNTKRTDFYQAIKIKTLCHHGMLSQVITMGNITRDESRTRSVATKLMIQICAKLGGEPWRVHVPETEKEEPWMIIGYDAYHDKFQKRSVGAFVATINKSWSKYHSRAVRYNHNEEISPTFEDDTLRALRAYAEENENSLPGKIIVYRDGIGQGDLERIIEMEAKAVERAVQKAKRVVRLQNKEIGIAYVIVSKKINTRFFLKESRGLLTNPICGTAVDSVVTLPERFEFFLVSQNTNQGTVSPTNYNVIYNTANLTQDKHQRTAYFLTHLYYNWAGTLKVPAPVQYAHKLAYLCGESLVSSECGPNHKLELFPYYL